MCDDKKSPLSDMFGECCVDSSRCFVLLLLDFPKLFICFYVMGICKKQG